VEVIVLYVPALVRRRRKNQRKLVIAGGLLVAVFAAAAALEQGRTRLPLATAEEKSSVTQSRTVYGGEHLKPPTNETAPTGITTEQKNPGPVPAGSDDTAGSRKREETDSNVPSDIVAFLDYWRNTMWARNVAAQADCYAPRVERFFTKTNVTREEVRKEKQRMLERYPIFETYKISNLKLLSLTADRATITFRKDWYARGTHRFAGAEQQRLTLTRNGGRWRIVGEEEVKVYWVKRS